MISSWTAHENDCKNDIESINKSNQQSTNQPIKPTINQSRSTNQVVENNGLVKSATLAKAKTNQEAIDQMIMITTNIADSIG